MENKTVKSKMNIGSSSLILIFIVLCLATFGLLSLSSARSDWNLTGKNAEMVRGYYEADREGLEFLRMIDGKLIEIHKSLADKDRKEAYQAELGKFYQADKNLVTTSIAMNQGLALQIELALVEDPDLRYEIQTWKVYHQIDYKIDDSMPVWDGT